MNVIGIASAAFALVVWGVTFANTRALLMDFSASGERYCKQHSSARAPKKAPEKCRSFTADGKPCSSAPAPGKRYCEKHLK